MIINGPSATLGRELITVRYGSNTFDKNLFDHNIVAIIIPKIDAIEKLKTVSYKVIPICPKRSFLEYRFDIVFIILEGEEYKNVLISSKFANSSHIIKKRTIILIWVILTTYFSFLIFFKYDLCSSLNVDL